MVNSNYKNIITIYNFPLTVLFFFFWSKLTVLFLVHTNNKEVLCTGLAKCDWFHPAK